MQNSEESLSSRGTYSSFLSASLKGISQVIFIENVVSGLIILLAITISSYKLGIIALLSAFIGTFIGKICGANENSISQGLVGYNSVLTGIALTLFLSGPYHWIIRFNRSCRNNHSYSCYHACHEKHRNSNSHLTFYHTNLVYVACFLSLKSHSFKPCISAPRFITLGIKHRRRIKLDRGSL